MIRTKKKLILKRDDMRMGIRFEGKNGKNVLVFSTECSVIYILIVSLERTEN